MSGAPLPDRSRLEAHQLARLRDLIRAIMPDNAFYAPRLGAAELADPLESLEEFREKVPLTLKAELAADQDEHPPYGSNLTYPLDRYTRLHQTSSTTGKPLRWLDTPESWAWMLGGWKEVFAGAGVGPQHRVFVAFSFGPFIGLWMAFDAAVDLGCLCVPGGAMNSVTRLKAILANDIDVLCCTPTYAIRLGEVAREEGMDLSGSAVRSVIVGGEPGASIPATRARIEELWPGARVFDHYGMTEVGPVTFQCPHRTNTVHVLESSYLCEVVDPATGEAVPLESGRTGELVLTTLGRFGSPALRYRTGDLVRPCPPSPCPCGRTTLTFEGGIIGRVDDMVVVRGVNLFPSAVDQIIRSHRGVAEYRVEINAGPALAELKVLIEPVAPCPDQEALRRDVEKAFRDTYNLRVPVRVVGNGDLPRFDLKARRWIKVDS